MSSECQMALDRHLESARIAIAQKRFDDALASLTSALVLDSSNGEALTLAVEIGELEEQARLESLLVAQESEPGMTHTSPLGEQKIEAHLAKARKHFAENQFDLALAEITLALLVNPFDDESQGLEKEIQDAIGRNSGEKQSPTSASLTTILHVARRYLQRGKLEEALEEVISGLELDEHNPELLSLQAAIVRQLNEQKAEENRAGRSEVNSVEAATLEADRRMRLASHCMSLDEFDEALAEIALGLLMQPEHDGLKRLEKEVWDAKNKADAGPHPPSTENTPGKDATEAERRIRMHLLAAEQFARLGNFAVALDEIAGAYLIDPSHAGIKKAETRIRQSQNKTSTTTLTLVYSMDQAANAR